METILYKPLFINPQAYYVFPNINGRLEPKTGSGKEPAIFVGNIEVKTIAHGDIGKKQYFYNTNEIDLSAFSNSLVRISLYTSRGNVVLGEWNLDVVEGESEDYIDPEVLASLAAVCICDGKSNNDPDRAVIKNLVDPDNPFVISNAAYEGMSGHNGYPVVFGANKTWEQMPTGTFTWNIDDNKLHITKALIAGNGLLFSYVKLNGSLLNVKEIPSFKIKVSGLEGKSKLWYRYLKTEDAISETIAVLENGTHELPKSYTPSDSLHDGVWVGFTVSPISEGVKEFDCDITIEVLPEYESSFCLDGVDDFVTIPTLAHGGKQVLMKVNLQSYDRYLYDQRNNWSQYLAIVSAGNSIAYEYSNKGGKTYIDGILNEHIIDKDLLNITHNITATNSGNGKSYSPNIGTSFARGNFAQMALFDFMLFPEISSENEIKELNDIIGIEGNTDDLLTKINI